MKGSIEKSKKTTSDILYAIALIVYVGYTSLYCIIDAASGKIRYIIVLLAVFLCVLANVNIKFTKKTLKAIVPWVIFCTFILLNNRIGITSFSTVRIVAGIVLILLLAQNEYWVKILPNAMIGFCGINVLATYFFLIYPQSYLKIISFFGYAPAGTIGGTTGYRAGIANHYSANAYFITYVLIALCVIWMVKGSIGDKNRKNLVMCLTVAALGALLLTAKRSALLFGILTLVIVYMLINIEKKLTRFVKVILLLIVLISIFLVISEYIPAFSMIIQRFYSIGDDTGSRERLAMWELALTSFAEHPILGIGFGGFRYLYNQQLFGAFGSNAKYAYLDAHNVYLQVLCETGIIGFIVYMSALIVGFTNTLRLLKMPQVREDYPLFRAIALSTAIQIFYFIYSFTGNCLYDVSFSFYVFALAVTFAVNNKVGRMSSLKSNGWR